MDLAQRFDEIAGAQVPGCGADLAAGNRCVTEYLAQVVDALLDDPIGLSGYHLVGAGLVFQILHDVTDENRPDRTQRERQVELESAALDSALIEPALGEQEHAKRLQTAVAQRELVTLMILSESARAARAGGEVHVVLGNLLGTRLLGPVAQKVGQIACREARRATLADIRERAPGEQILPRCGGKDLGPVAEPVERGLDDTLCTPVQTSEQDCHVLALVSHERTRLVRSEMLRGSAHHDYSPRCLCGFLLFRFFLSMVVFFTVAAAAGPCSAREHT